jgi:hypothetical protein
MFQATEEYSQGVRSADPVQCDNRIFGGTERRRSSTLLWLRGHREILVNEATNLPNSLSLSATSSVHLEM